MSGVPGDSQPASPAKKILIVEDSFANLMDVALGTMDGWQATRLIKADARTARIPVIALTAHALESDRQKSVEAGCADFDTKPVDLTRLLEKIQRCLTSARAGRSSPNERSDIARQDHIEGVACHVDN